MNSLIDKSKKIVRNMLFCISLIRNANKRTFAALTFLTLLTSIFPLISVYITKRILDELSLMLFDGELNICMIVLMLAGYAISSCISSVFMFLLNKGEVIHIQNMLKYLNVGVMKKSVLLDVSSFDIPERYESFRRGKNNVMDFQRIVFDTMQAICSILSFVVSSIIAFKLSPIYVAAAILFCVPKSIWTRKKREMEYEFQKSVAIEEKRKSYLFDILFQKKSAIELKYNNMDGEIFKRYRKILNDINEKRNKFSLKNNLKSLLICLPDKLVLAIVNIDVISRIVHGSASIGDFSYYVGVFDTLLLSLNELSDNLATYIAFDEKIDEYKAFFEKDEEKNKGKQKLEAITSIVFDKVSFTYPGNEIPAVKDVSFRISKGENVFLLGFNGSGKSTIVKLLCGFYQADSGTIFINDLPIEHYDELSLRECVTAVFQDYVTYSLSLRESIVFDNVPDEERDKQILDALRSAELNVDEIEGMSLDSYINKEFHEDGYELSGGQKQKIAVARACYRKASLQLMDEPTASLDPEAEAAVLQHLLSKDSERINIVVSHCLANAKKADKVIFLNNGNLVGTGTHEWMMGEVPEYRHFYEIQREKYV